LISRRIPRARVTEKANKEDIRDLAVSLEDLDSKMWLLFAAGGVLGLALLFPAVALSTPLSLAPHQQHTHLFPSNRDLPFSFSNNSLKETNTLM
jgi:hypothetical protein